MNILPANASNAKKIELYWKKGFSFRLYEDTMPWNKEIREIQKGLVLIHDGVELIGEGGGFGLPLAMYKDKTVFPGSAWILFISDKKVVKEFELDRISKKAFNRFILPDGLVRKIEDAFNVIYLSSGFSRKLLDWLIRVRRFVGLKTMFTEIESRGRVRATYELCADESICVTLYFRLITSDLFNLVVLNEQSAEYFTLFQDSNGVSLSKENIGAWSRVNSESSSFCYPFKGVSFTLRSKVGVDLFRGWELIPGSHSWAGLDYCFEPRKKFEYKIRLIQSTCRM